MSSLIAYTPELLDMSKLEEFYADLEINPKEHFNNMKRTNLFVLKFNINEFRKEVNKSDWRNYIGFATEVNAHYNPFENKVLFNAASLQGFHFSDDRPMVMNFGTTGSIIGHELTHGFDDQGKQFNWEGNMEDWWEPETDAKYCKTLPFLQSDHFFFSGIQRWQSVSSNSTTTSPSKGWM